MPNILISLYLWRGASWTSRKLTVTSSPWVAALPRDDVASAMANCRVCGGDIERLFEGQGHESLTSSAMIVPGRTVIDLCLSCGHASTHPIADLQSYYSSEYNFLAQERDQDDLYERKVERNVYRSEQQAAIVEAKIDCSRVLSVLDFGCAKAQSLCLLTQRHKNLSPFVFDVSDSYRKFWDEFVPPAQQASFKVPESWAVDLILSFFVLEHVPDPVDFLVLMRRLLRPQGQLLLIVPNMVTNISDMLVVDHINHFSRASLVGAFSKAGFGGVEVDDASFRGAFVVTARNTQAALNIVTDGADSVRSALQVRDAWLAVTSKVRSFEAAQSVDQTSAIYGSGIYGLYIATCLRHPARLTCFLDQNPYRNGLSFLGAPVLPVSDVSDEISAVYVGLNPQIAHDVIRGVPELARRPREYVFLD